MYYVALIAVASSLMQFLLLPVYIRLKKRQKYLPLKMTIKGLMTFIAFGFALYAVLVIRHRTGSFFNLVTESGMKTHILLPIGLFVCMVADVVLCVEFKIGMLMFLAGHICYSAYFLIIGGFNPVSVVIFVISAAAITLYFSRYTRKEGKMFILYTVYGIMISITLSTGLMLPFSIREYGVMPAISSVLLVVSDIMLGMNKVRKTTIISDLQYLGYYFSGQFVLALSVFVPAVLGV
jgi:uncharacterized membrane protein YhhN